MHFSRGEQIVIALGLLILLLAGAVWLYLAGSRADRYEEEALFTPPPVAPVEPEKQVLVHICGQVRRPGVYRVKPANRVLEVIKFAGGPTRQADIHALNLAARVEDGTRIYVPSKAETQAAVAGAERPPVLAADSARRPPPAPPSRASPAAPGQKSSQPPGKININTATAAQLELLPRVGPAIARRILEYRQKNGFFGKPEDLMAVPGIGEKTFAQMQPYVTVAPP
jgi:competence protein ComEA